MKWSILFFLFAGYGSFAQHPAALDSAIRRLTEEKDPEKSISYIIKEYGLDKNKDAETLDALYGTAAVTFATKGEYKKYENYIGRIRNKFNQTSFMNMAASKILEEEGDAAFAKQVAEKTIALYKSFRNDPTAKPKEISKADWQRFMDFAQYPYYDTYAQALFALNKYKEALEYQRMAFDSKPEEGLPASVQRYAKLLELTGKKEEAKRLLLTMASLGKLNKGMEDQLHSIYISENASDEAVGALLDSLQKNVQATLIRKLRQNMRNETAPAFTLKDINGKEVKLSDYAGKIVVLDLWATWCKPCIASFPAMQILVEKHPGVAFLFIAVNEKGADPLSTVKNFIEKRKYHFTVLLDEQNKIMAAYKPNGIPAKYIIDKNGKLRFNTSGFDTDRELMNELEAMFAILQ